MLYIGLNIDPKSYGLPQSSYIDNSSPVISYPFDPNNHPIIRNNNKQQLLSQSSIRGIQRDMTYGINNNSIHSNNNNLILPFQDNNNNNNNNNDNNSILFPTSSITFPHNLNSFSQFNMISDINNNDNNNSNKMISDINNIDIMKFNDNHNLSTNILSLSTSTDLQSNIIINNNNNNVISNNIENKSQINGDYKQSVETITNLINYILNNFDDLKWNQIKNETNNENNNNTYHISNPNEIFSDIIKQ